MLRGKLLGAFADKINVRTLTQNLPPRAPRIAHPLPAPHAASPQRGALHDERVELHPAIAVEKAAASRVESLVVFHDDNGFLNRVQRRPATLQHAPSRSQRVVHAANVRLDHVVRHSPRAAMHHENGISSHVFSFKRRVVSTEYLVASEATG